MISLFVISLYILLPYRRVSDRWSSGSTEISLLRMWETLFSKVALGVVKRGHRVRKCSVVSLPVSQGHIGEGQFTKP